MTNAQIHSNAVQTANNLLRLLDTTSRRGTFDYDAKRDGIVKALKRTVIEFDIKPEETNNPVLCRKYVDRFTGEKNV